MNPTLYFESKEETVGAECISLSHHHYVAMVLELKGTRQALDSAKRMLNGEKGRIYFHRSGHKFYPCDLGYTSEFSGGTLKLKANDTRIVGTPDKLWECINQHPFETPMLPEWEPILRLALQGTYLKPLAGYEQKGEYLSVDLSPRRLDEVVCGLVRRKVIQF